MGRMLSGADFGCRRQDCQEWPRRWGCCRFEGSGSRVWHPSHLCSCALCRPSSRERGPPCSEGDLDMLPRVHQALGSHCSRCRATWHCTRFSRLTWFPITQTSSAATPETAAQARVAQGQALRLTSARLAGRLRSNPLFNISAHLGLGAQASHQAVSSDKDSPQVSLTAAH